MSTKTLAKDENNIMELVNLRAFVTVADYGSLRKAAQTLFVAESTISRQIKSLEEELHVELFARTHKNLQLSEAGKKLLPEAQRILNDVAILERSAKGLMKDNACALTVGYCGLPYEEDALVNTTKTLRREFDGLSVMLEIDRSRNLVEKVLDGKLDMAFLYDGSIPDTPLLCMKELGATRSVALLPKAHRLAHKATIRLADLQNESILFEYRESSPLMYDAVLSAFKSYGLTSFEPVYTQDYRSIPAMVATGQGITLSSAWLENPMPKNIAIRELQEPLYTTCVLIWLTENENPMLEPFAGILKRYFEQMYLLE